eukprot:m.132878 g.132878  ORF g.132878 m.132878 type:complete len:100 (-) comp9488_c0_seq51:1491-1790(-)
MCVMKVCVLVRMFVCICVFVCMCVCTCMWACDEGVHLLELERLNVKAFKYICKRSCVFVADFSLQVRFHSTIESHLMRQAEDVNSKTFDSLPFVCLCCG